MDVKESTQKKLKNKERSPYLPAQHGYLKEAAIRLRSFAAYWIWYRTISNYKVNNTHLNFLEIGCGSGNYISCLERWFHDINIFALDLDTDLIHYTSSRTSKTRFLQANAEQLPFTANTFHILSGLQVIEHFPSPEHFLNEAYRVLKKDGLLLLSTPNPAGFAARLLGTKWQGIRSDHISLRAPEQWHSTLKKSGFNLLREGTTLINGVPIIGRFPVGLPFQILQTLFGCFLWKSGESYMVIAKKIS